MAIITNDRDIALQATSPRLLSVSTNYISLIPSSSTVATTKTGILPSSVNIHTIFNGILTGTVTWDIVPVVPYTLTVDGINILGSDIPLGTSIEITASLTFLGNIYTASTTVTHTANSSSIKIYQTAANTNRSSSGVYTPTFIGFSGKISDGISVPTTYQGRYVVDTTLNGTLYTNIYTSTIDEPSYTYTPSLGEIAVRVRLYPAGSTTFTSNMLDEASATISVSGIDGIVYTLEPSTFVLAKNQNNVYNPTKVTFRGKYKIGDSPKVNYSGRFAIYENGSSVESYLSSVDELSTVYTPTVSCNKIKGVLYAAGSYDTKLDEQTVSIVTSGAHAISAILTNESHTFPSLDTGEVSSYANSGTEVYVYEGADLLGYNEAGYIAGNNSTWSITTTSINITPGTLSDWGTYAKFGNASVVSDSIDTSSITYDIAGRTSIGTLFTVSKTQRFSKSKQGPMGPEGPTDITALVTKAGESILTGTIVPTNTGAIRVGSITWNSTTGSLISGPGIAITEWGIIGANASSQPTFTIRATDGQAIFMGDIIGGANINIVGDLISSGSNPAATNVNIGGVLYAIDYSIYGKALTEPAIPGNVRAGVLGNSTTTSSQYNVGVLGVAGDASRGIGVVGSGGLVGVYARSGGGNALEVNGKMFVSSTLLVTNLNADMLDGNHGVEFCQRIYGDTGLGVVSSSNLIFVSTVADTRISGSGNTLTLETISDARKKKNIEPEIYGLDFINSLKPVQYYLIDRPTIKYHGFLAQDIQPLILGSDDSLFQVHKDGVFGSDYISLIAPLVKAIQEQTDIINNLVMRLNLLENINE